MKIDTGYVPHHRGQLGSWPAIGAQTSFLVLKPPQDLLRFLHSGPSLLPVGLLRRRWLRWVGRPACACWPTRQAALRRRTRRSYARGGRQDPKILPSSSRRSCHLQRGCPGSLQLVAPGTPPPCRGRGISRWPLASDGPLPRSSYRTFLEAGRFQCRDRTPSRRKRRPLPPMSGPRTPA